MAIATSGAMVAVAPLSLSFPRIRIEVASRAWLDVRRFAVEEAVSKLFHVELEAHSEAPNLDLDTIVGKEAMFCLETDFAGPYSWAGLCSEMEQTAVSPEGYSTYRLVVVPTLWLATQRRNHRSFQRCSELDIAAALLNEWGIEAEYRVDPGAYKAREYRVQYGESDYAFFCRMLEDAGISFFFEDGGRLVLADAPHEASVYGELPFVDSNEAPPPREYVSGVRIGRRIRPGRYSVRDHDFRRPPQYLLAADSTGGDDVESRLERFHYEPGSFAYESQQGEASPVADDKLRVRSDIEEGDKLARRRLDAKRATARVVSFDTNAQYVAAGTVLTIGEHPHAALAGKPILVVARTMRGSCNAVWSQRCDAVSTEFPYRPPVATPKPRVNGVESATVVGPPGEEIHTDEFGRVRVHFHWDRESRMDDNSSCWIPVSQPWSGAGFGGMNLPRIGQEVVVDFLGGDPDRPIVVGRVYTNLQPVPYKLPDHKTKSGWRSLSSPGGGGFNELMFEDAKGRELMNVQAERDLHKLVKNDERVVIGHDRDKRIAHDETVTVGNDRLESVGNNEEVAIAGDRSVLVRGSAREVIGKHRARVVGGNEDIQIGSNRSLKVSGNEQRKISRNQSLAVGKKQSVKVGRMATETVGILKTLQVGVAYQISVGAMMSTTVAGVSIEKVGKKKSVSAGKRLELKCGKAKIILESSGKIILKGVELLIEGEEKVVMKTGDLLAQGKNVVVQGEKIDLN